MKFMCLVYLEPDAFEGVTQDELTKLTDDTIVEDNDLREKGHLLIGQPLLGPETAVTLRGGKRGGGRTDGPFLETKEWLGGFTLIEAKDMEEAIALTKDSAIMGTVDECVAQLKEHLAVGTQKLIFVPYKYEMDQIETIAKEIITRLKA